MYIYIYIYIYTYIFCIYNLHFFKQKVYRHQELSYNIPKRTWDPSEKAI